jgi:hypothetical protein
MLIIRVTQSGAGVIQRERADIFGSLPGVSRCSNLGSELHKEKYSSCY